MIGYELYVKGAPGYQKASMEVSAIGPAFSPDDEHGHLYPVVIDDVTENDPNIPTRFWQAHYARLPGGEPTPECVDRVQQLYRKYQKRGEEKRRMAAID